MLLEDALHCQPLLTSHAGFNYQLDALSGKYNELNKAFSHVLGEGNFMTPSVVLKLLFPFLRILVCLLSLKLLGGH